jgi:mono/diheme cytochrome c family protein
MGMAITRFKQGKQAVDTCSRHARLQSSPLGSRTSDAAEEHTIIRKFILLAIVLAAVGGGVFWFLTIPTTIAASELPEHEPDLANGAYIFAAGGCSSCHAAPGAKGEDKLVLSGGLALETPFGTFNVPNISPDAEHGIGDWTPAEFIRAMKYGIGRGGEHLYPAFPYTSYQRMRVEDIIDLKAYLDTLPPVASNVPPHDLPFPFNIRRGLGLWQLLYVDGKTFDPDPAISAELNRGAYLVRGPGHCGECHSPRNFIGGTIASRAYSGGPAPEGDGTIPNITPDSETGIGSWSESDIVEAFESGFKPDFDTFGGSMVAVQQNLAKLTPEDLKAIALFLKSLPPIKSDAK